MKLDVTAMRYLTKDDYRVLTAVEMGMRNHELVPVPLILSIAGLRHGGAYKILSTLLRHKLVAHALQEYDGYRLSYLGYDILALHTLQCRGVITAVGSQVGIGKESDIFEAMTDAGDEVIVKIHRLGRTSFRAVRRHRDYVKHKSKTNWLYLSRIAALKEFSYMKALFAYDFPVPTPLDHNRHVVVMSKVQGFPLSQLRAGALVDAAPIFTQCVKILQKLFAHGLIHCDFNEFNLLINQQDSQITLIDFPQMISITHVNATELLQRDLQGLVKFFTMKMKFSPPEEILQIDDWFHGKDGHGVEIRIDQEVHASGFDEEEGENIMDIELFPELHHVADAHAKQEEEQEAEEEGDEEKEERSDEEQVATDGTQQRAALTNQEEEDDQAAVEDEQEGGSEPDSSAKEEEENTQQLSSKPRKEPKATRTQDDDHQTKKQADALNRLRSDVLMKSRHGKQKHHHSRNQTKKRNKYGRIVKVDKLEY